MIKQAIRLVALILIALGLITLLSPANPAWVQGYLWLGNKLWQLLLDLARIGLITLIFAGLLAPFESLGWWAGWYGDDPPAEQLPTLAEAAAGLPDLPHEPSRQRYVVYLDGISQNSEEYAPRVQGFLEQLAAELPPEMLLIQDIMTYSVTNRLLTDSRPLAAFWRWVNQVRAKRLKNFLGLFVNVRNLYQVAVSTDSRYGPIFNRGTAEVILEGLVQHGYPLGSSLPVTLVGYSGGAQVALGAVTYLKGAIAAPIEVISIAGVISGNTGVLELERLYHLVGNYDPVAKLGAVMFPKRWPLLSWSNWNLARSRGKISFISLGPVDHDSADGPLDADADLPDGRSNLRQTLDIIHEILTRADGADPFEPELPSRELEKLFAGPRTPSNYEIFLQAPFNRPDYYHLEPPDPSVYRPVSDWLGRLILPPREQRQDINQILFEVHHAPHDHQNLVGQVVTLRWQNRPATKAYIRRVSTDLYFNDQAEESIHQGRVHPERLNHWRQVNPLESLVGAHPIDDIVVRLRQPVVADPQSSQPSLALSREPVLITGQYYGLATILDALSEPADCFQVRHFSPASQQFDGKIEIIRIPPVLADRRGVFPATTRRIADSPLNEGGWYIYGAWGGTSEQDERFTVRAIAPRALFALQPERIVLGEAATVRYIRREYWQDAAQKKGEIQSVLLSARARPTSDAKAEAKAAAIADWLAGDRALVLHTFGGIGGQKKEFAPLGIFFGHFAFGLAQVRHEPLTQRLRFDINYRQVYTQNPSGIVAATLDWTNYMGDRQWGWLGSRPVADILVKLAALTEDYDFDGQPLSPLRALAYQLDIMMARYRTGDGTGTTFAGPANSCVQDSCQALYLAIQMIEREIKSNSTIRDWLQRYPEHPQTQRLEQLRSLGRAIENKLVPWRTLRRDWRESTHSLLGTRLSEQPIRTLANALTSWRSLLPRLASDQLAEIFLEHGASLWILRTHQVGGYDPTIQPLAPTKLWF
ncbi:hypothetical protein IQ241_23115 [Romeria aff. gracilis LEGE 07310]|uniref:CAAX protease n=1 Tax=Vasconcelosia minhoensis LEGE 07310 TaxID=915328 RepID=A0A8J7AYH8_9CYAN|nr:hypothetical protein [Romeria gracilis]MBE9080148.1 hypothetical protein [Romeria aff. gracilis LEGE 07310]